MTNVNDDTVRYGTWTRNITRRDPSTLRGSMNGDEERKDYADVEDSGMHISIKIGSKIKMIPRCDMDARCVNSPNSSSKVTWREVLTHFQLGFILVREVLN